MLIANLNTKRCLKLTTIFLNPPLKKFFETYHKTMWIKKPLIFLLLFLLRMTHYFLLQSTFHYFQHNRWILVRRQTSFTQFQQTVHLDILQIFPRQLQCIINMVKKINKNLTKTNAFSDSDQPPAYDQVVLTPVQTPTTPAIATATASVSRPPSFSQTQTVPQPA